MEIAGVKLEVGHLTELSEANAQSFWLAKHDGRPKPFGTRRLDGGRREAEKLSSQLQAISKSAKRSFDLLIECRDQLLHDNGAYIEALRQALSGSADEVHHEDRAFARKFGLTTD